MRKLIIAATLALSLGGCATFQRVETFFEAATSDVVPPQKALIAANTFDAVEIVGTKYLRLPRCPTAPICREPDVSASVISWLRAGRADRNTLKAAIRANPGQNLSLVAIYNDLNNLTTKITAVIGPLFATLSTH